MKLILLIFITALLCLKGQANNLGPGNRRRKPNGRLTLPSVRTFVNNSTLGTRLINNTVECDNGTFRCANGYCVPFEKVCNFRNDCGDRSDEMMCKRRFSNCWPQQTSCISDGTCARGFFQCNNGKCIKMSRACNRRDDCGDRSDEIRATPGLKCVFGSLTDICVLPQQYVNDTRNQCRDGGDRCYDERGKLLCFQCLDERLLIANTQVCDGVFDCFDLSDECLCEDRKVGNICDTLCLGDGKGCRKGTFTCGNSLHTANITDICNERVDCPNGIDEKHCRKGASSLVVSCPGNEYNDTTLTAFVCDGRPECFDLSDECGAGCLTEQPFCKLREQFVGSNNFVVKCSNGFNLSQPEICDGWWSRCSPRIEAEEYNCSARLYCSSRRGSISIDRMLQCNGYQDCLDGSDEFNCDRFYCGDRNQSVPKSFILDDFRDCRDGSDECPPYLDNSRFSSRNEMISNLFFRIWLWFMAITALVGNLYVIVTSVRKFKQLKNSSAVGKANHFLIFNLALADGLMGIYLITLAGYTIHFSGRYCFEDERWRTGRTCKSLGSLSVIASEASVYILAVLTGLRLYTVVRPIQSRSLQLRYVYLAAAIAWGVAVTLAVVPFSTSLRSSVIDGAWIPSKYFRSTTVNLTTLIKYSENVGLFIPNITTLNFNHNYASAWARITQYLQENNPNHSIRGLFGYYSSNSVCVSKLFVTTRQHGWYFTIAIVSVNLFIFLFVVGAYIAIYKVSTGRRPQQKNNDGNARLQSKIIKLVVTDFLCWIPICIMVFIHFSGIANLEGIAYVVTAVVLLPINSVLNPLLYSNVLEKLWKKMKNHCKWNNKEPKIQNQRLANLAKNIPSLETSSTIGPNHENDAGSTLGSLANIHHTRL